MSSPHRPPGSGRGRSGRQFRAWAVDGSAMHWAWAATSPRLSPGVRSRTRSRARGSRSRARRRKHVRTDPRGPARTPRGSAQQVTTRGCCQWLSESEAHGGVPEQEGGREICATAAMPEACAAAIAAAVRSSRERVPRRPVRASPETPSASLFTRSSARELARNRWVPSPQVSRASNGATCVPVPWTRNGSCSENARQEHGVRSASRAADAGASAKRRRPMRCPATGWPTRARRAGGEVGGTRTFDRVRGSRCYLAKLIVIRRDRSWASTISWRGVQRPGRTCGAPSTRGQPTPTPNLTVAGAGRRGTRRGLPRAGRAQHPAGEDDYIPALARCGAGTKLADSLRSLRLLRIVS